MTALLLVALAAGPARAPSRDDLFSVVRDRYEITGRTMPQVDTALERAAQELAQRALRTSAEEAANILAVTDAVSRNGGWEPSPVAIVIRASSTELLKALERQTDLATEPATLVGVGIASQDTISALCVLLVQRKVQLRTFTRVHPKLPKSQQLCATLLPPLASAELFVTRPAGDVDRVALHREKEELCAMVEFPTKGRHTVEVLARGPRGPEVGALFFVDVAVPPGVADDLRLGAEPRLPADIRAALLARVNTLRSSMGAGALTADRELDQIALRYAQRMANEAFFAHVAPDGSDLKQRLTGAKYRFSAAGENLGAASGPLAAHWGIEHSPGHRKNLLEPGYQRLGVGSVLRPDGQTVVVEILATPRSDDPDNPAAAAYSAIGEARQKKKLSVLKTSATLEALALEHAHQALDRDLPKAELPGLTRLHDRAFELLDDAATVSVDIFVTQNPAQIAESKNLANPKNDKVGVGVVKGSSEKYGSDQYWVVVIYAAPAE